MDAINKHSLYYFSRFFLSLAFALVVFGFRWYSLLFFIVLFGLFLFYLHSGWYKVSSNNTLFPLRRDTRGMLIQRKSLIAAIIMGIIAYLILTMPALRFYNPIGNLALSISILAYFVFQCIFFKMN